MTIHPPSLRRLAASTSLLVAAGLTFAPGVHVAQAQTVTKTAKKPAKKKSWPIFGMLTLSSSVAAGTFVPGEANRAGVSSSMSLMVMTRAIGVTWMLMQNVNKTLVNNVDDAAPRSRNTSLGDTVLLASWAPKIKGAVKRRKLTAKEEAAREAAMATNPTLASSGKGQPLTLPGGIRMSFLGVLSLPTSRAARFQTRLATLALATNFRRRIGPVSLTYQLRGTKFFHRYSNALLPADQAGLFARTNGVEAVTDEYVATAVNNTSFNIRNSLIANVPGPGKLSFQVVYILINNFRYYDAPLDEFSSQYAKAGRGRSDLSYGQLAANYVFPGGYIGSLSLSSYSAPFSADNNTVRFPFFDLRSTPDNLSTVGLSVTKMF